MGSRASTEMLFSVMMGEVFDGVCSPEKFSTNFSFLDGNSAIDLSILGGRLVTLSILPTSGGFLKYPGGISDTLSSFLTVRTLVSAQLGYNKSAMFILE